MKNLLKKALVMAALAMCFGFAVYIGTVNMPAVTASGNDSGTGGSGTGEGEGDDGDEGGDTGTTTETPSGNDGTTTETPSGNDGTTTETPSGSSTSTGTSGGNSTSTGTSSWDWNFSCSSVDLGFDKDLNGMIGGTPVGGVIEITKEDGRSSLDIDLLKKIVDRDQTLVMEYTYNGVDYRIVIPGKSAVLDESVPIYGPLYLAAHYSSNAAVGGSSGGATYTIAKGDTLSRIAATNGTTVAALMTLNPQIKNVNVIYVGQTINLQ